MAIEKCYDLVSNLVVMSKKSSLEDVKDGANGIVDSIANSLIVKRNQIYFILFKFLNHFFQGLSSPLNSRTTFLSTDSNLNADPTLTDEEKCNNTVNIQIIFHTS